MTEVVITKSFPALQEKDINRLERNLDITFPEDYRNFLLKYNGGHPQPNVFPIRNCPIDNQGILVYLLGVHSKNNSILDFVETYSGRIPADLLPIGFDPGGNIICLSVSGANRGKVYFWAHDFEALPDETPGYDNVYQIADSFDELMRNLKDLA